MQKFVSYSCGENSEWTYSMYQDRTGQRDLKNKIDEI